MKHAEDNRKMFDNIAHGYDRTNDIISLGRYQSWMKHIVESASVDNNSKILDCATGTGNVAIEFKSRYPGSEVKGVDVSEGMLEIARRKINDLDLEIELFNSDILDLPFSNSYFNSAAISFGIRNTESFERCLIEMARVVKSGGTIVILETAKLNGFSKYLYRFIQSVFIRPVGRKLTGDLEAYDWLTDSSNNFPDKVEFIRLMNSTSKFSSISSKSFMFNSVYLYTGIVK